MEKKALSIAGIGKKIQKYRRSYGLSQENLAEELGIDTTMISKIENGRKSNLPVDLLMDIAAFFHVTIDALCYDNAGKEHDDSSGSLISDQKEAARILERLSAQERAFMMKILRGAA